MFHIKWTTGDLRDIERKKHSDNDCNWLIKINAICLPAFVACASVGLASYAVAVAD